MLETEQGTTNELGEVKPQRDWEQVENQERSESYKALEEGNCGQQELADGVARPGSEDNILDAIFLAQAVTSAEWVDNDSDKWHGYVERRRFLRNGDIKVQMQN